MVRMTTDEIMALMEQIENVCQHNCDQCFLWLPKEKMCFYDADKRWQEWNIKEHQRFGKVLKGE